MSTKETETYRVSVVRVQTILDKIHPVLVDEDYSVLQDLLNTYVTVLNQLSEKTASLSRLRKLFGLKTTERLPPKSSDEESPNDGELAKPQDEEPTESNTEKEDEGQAPEPVHEAPFEDEPSAEPPKPPKKKRGGPLPGTAYKAENTHIEHPDLNIGQACPKCAAEASIRFFRTTEPRVWLIGQAPVVAKSVTTDTYRCSTCDAVFTPELPEEAHGPKVRPSAVAVIIYLHYLAGMPFERFEVLQKEAGVPLAASIQWEKSYEAAKQLAPLYEFLLERAYKAWLFHIDDSPAKVLELTGQRRPQAIEDGLIAEDRTGVQTTGLIAFDVTGPPVALFFTGPQHAGENLALLLRHRPDGLDKPLVMCDALNRNILRELKDHVIEANCMAHGRRGVHGQLDSFPAEAHHVLSELAKVFAVDAEARLNELSKEERLTAHQRRSAPVLGHLRKWIRIQLDQRVVEPNSEMGKALKYILRHWRKLTCFLREAGAPVTNNLCERLLKTAIRYRKNSNFYKTLVGAEVGDLFMSLMQTARLSEVDPLHYMTSLLEHADEVAQAPASWTPWAYQNTLEAYDNTTTELRAA